MENIGKFLEACDSYGVQKADLFQTVDLYEGTNIPQVIIVERTVLYIAEQAELRRPIIAISLPSLCLGY